MGSLTDRAKRLNDAIREAGIQAEAHRTGKKHQAAARPETNDEILARAGRPIAADDPAAASLRRLYGLPNPDQSSMERVA